MGKFTKPRQIRTPRDTFPYGKIRQQIALNRMQRLQVAQIINSKQEFKIFNNSINTSVSATPVVIPLLASGSNGPAQGSAENERIGEKIMLKYMWFNISAYIPDSGDTTNFIRMILFQWKDRSIPSTTDILVTANDYIQLHNFERRQQYKVLYDRVVPFTYNGDNAKAWTLKIKNANKDLTYAGTEVQKNGMYMFLVSDSSAVVHPVLNLRCRSYYTDS